MITLVMWGALAVVLGYVGFLVYLELRVRQARKAIEHAKLLADIAKDTRSFLRHLHQQQAIRDRIEQERNAHRRSIK